MTAGLINAVSKITIKEVLKGKPEKEDVTVVVRDESGAPVLDKDGKEVTTVKKLAKAQDVAVVMGKVHAHRTGKTTYGEFTEYAGVVQARRLKDGEIFQSSRYIPGPIASDLLWNMYSSQKEKDQTAVIEFAFVIGVEPSERGTDGYKWTCKPILSAEQTAQVTDPFADILARVQAAGITVPGIEAPAEAPAIESKKK